MSYFCIQGLKENQSFNRCIQFARVIGLIESREERPVKRHVRKAGQSQIAQDVLAYLVEHPQAQDALEGITHWWLLEQEIARRTAEVQLALADLVMKGLVLERQGSDGRIHYRINQSKSEEIREFLEERSKRRKRDQNSKRESFIIGFWVDESSEENAPARWRGQITHVPSGKMVYLQSFDGILNFILPFLEALGARVNGIYRD